MLLELINLTDDHIHLTDNHNHIQYMLFLLSNDDNRTVYHQRTYLFTAVFDFEFIFGLYLLKVILLNTDTFKSYFRGKSIDLVIVQKTAYSVNVVLK